MLYYTHMESKSDGRAIFSSITLYTVFCTTLNAVCSMCSTLAFQANATGRTMLVAQWLSSVLFSVRLLLINIFSLSFHSSHIHLGSERWKPVYGIVCARARLVRVLDFVIFLASVLENGMTSHTVHKFFMNVRHSTRRTDRPNRRTDTERCALGTYHPG